MSRSIFALAALTIALAAGANTANAAGYGGSQEQTSYRTAATYDDGSYSVPVSRTACDTRTRPTP